MARFQSCILTAVTGVLFIGIGFAQTRRFYPDDPIQADPRPVDVGEINGSGIYAPYDYFYQTGRQKLRASGPALAVNTLGEVPDSAWFTNRHGRARRTRSELQRGAGNENAPQPPYLIIGAKSEGITPGFRMRDARGRLYYVKTDPISNPELTTGADVMGSKFFHAIGYNTPENYLVRIRRSDWIISDTAKLHLQDRISRKLTAKDLLDILAKAPLLPDGSIRAVASYAIPGKGLGPFRYEGTRSDDPNDLVPHEDRRDLRGLFVFCAWLNHTDAKADNSHDTLVQEDGISFIRHYLIDFGSAFGSDGDVPKDARFGHEYQISTFGSILRQLLGLGLYSPEWERIRYPNQKSAGRIDAKIFNPERWKPNYPNPAFLNRRPDDEYWAAKIVLAFSDEDIRALVETGEYSDPLAVEYLVRTLVERRDKIGRCYLSKVLPLEGFTVHAGELRFEDLAVRHQFRPPLEYRVSWSLFDNQNGTFTPLAEESMNFLPERFSSIAEGDYLAARICVRSDVSKTVTVFLRKRASTAEVAGLERGW